MRATKLPDVTWLRLRREILLYQVMFIVFQNLNLRVCASCPNETNSQYGAVDHSNRASNQTCTTIFWPPDGRSDLLFALKITEYGDYSSNEGHGIITFPDGNTSDNKTAFYGRTPPAWCGIYVKASTTSQRTCDPAKILGSTCNAIILKELQWPPTVSIFIEKYVLILDYQFLDCSVQNNTANERSTLPTTTVDDRRQNTPRKQEYLTTHIAIALGVLQAITLVALIAVSYRSRKQSQMSNLYSEKLANHASQASEQTASHAIEDESAAVTFSTGKTEVNNSLYEISGKQMVNNEIYRTCEGTLDDFAASKCNE